MKGTFHDKIKSFSDKYFVTTIILGDKKSFVATIFYDKIVNSSQKVLVTAHMV